MSKKQFVVYILSNESGSVLYTGVTSNLPRRIQEHREGTVPGFTSKYKVHRLVYAEPCESAYQAITREKQIKGGSRKKKLDLIRSLNPEWKDIADHLT